MLIARWLERIAARVALSRTDVFPTDELLNHVPLLIDGIAAYLEDTGRDIDAEVPVTSKARELGAMRYEQGFDAYEILKEQELLGSIVMTYSASIVDELAPDASPGDVAACWNRLREAIEFIRQATTTHFLQLAAERISEREERLRSFNRMVSHELKGHLSAIRGAASLLAESWIDESERERFIGIVGKNADALVEVLNNLAVLSRLETDARQQRNVLLPQAVAEVVRKLREPAEANRVSVSVSPALPSVEVNAAAVEVCLTNYVSNAIKYADRVASERWLEISADLIAPGVSQVGGELVVRVRDNGLGVPVAARPHLFRRFFRAHNETVTGVEGTGLGLNIVRETVELLGGRAWAEHPQEGGSVFAFSLPSRRAEDAATAGVTRGS